MARTPEIQNPEMVEFLPISPDQALEQQYKSLPYFIVKVINTILAKEFDGFRVTIKIKDLVEKILEGAQDREMNPGGMLAFKDLTSNEIFNNKWVSEKTLNAQYGPAGWIVSGNYPDYTESFDSILTFNKKKK